ncbi:hypothetical protein GCM10009745_24930 [Kribbella yunnanensis]|uniref:Uncharacterized protein n=1 Tax=Kribbella yunnanensis TaxID=190194 RepID=A0ABP4T012_9ACTN
MAPNVIRGRRSHGTDESITLSFCVGCALNRQDYVLTAHDRLGKAIDPEDSANKQSIDYARVS